MSIERNFLKYFDFKKILWYNIDMKDKRNKHIKILAQKIVRAEKEILLGNNVQENQAKIENIMGSLTLTEALELDEYIYRKKLLTK